MSPASLKKVKGGRLNIIVNVHRILPVRSSVWYSQPFVRHCNLGYALDERSYTFRTP
jgi:hypothetical protein